MIRIVRRKGVVATGVAALGGAVIGAVMLAPTASADPVTSGYYLSVGDSYAAGWQPGGMTTQGYANQLLPKARARGYDLTLVNVACAGATTTSLLRRKGCTKDRRPIGGPSYGRLTQIQAATKFLRRHRGQVELVTVSVGGNDVTECGRGAVDPIACVATATQEINDNVGLVARKLRRAAGPGVTIIGSTYPDVLLGQWVRPPVNQDIARLSTVAFKDFINPALRSAYASGDAGFVDVTAATGAYGSLDRLTELPPYGEIPVPVAKVCTLTWFCAKGDIHARTKGYGIIAGLMARTLPVR